MSAPPKTPDGEPEQRATDAPPADAAQATDGRMEPDAPAAGPAQDGPQIARTDDRPQRRRRRRRRRPRLDPAEAGRAAAPAESPAAPPQALGDEAAAEGSPAAPAEDAASPQPTPGTPPRKRRRRRRRPPPEGGAVQAAAGEPAAAASGAAGQPSSATERKEPRRSRAPHRPPREERPRERNNRGERSSGPRADADRGARGKRDKRGGRGPTDRPRRRDREEARSKPAPKLHHLETVVDRGFEDVPDPATEGATRRADWTILKRTTADQRTARAVSMIYVLRRDGVETEFAQLSAARAAVNKIITHPEKTTPSKADHAAARGGKK